MAFKNDIGMDKNIAVLNEKKGQVVRTNGQIIRIGHVTSIIHVFGRKYTREINFEFGEIYT